MKLMHRSSLFVSLSLIMALTACKKDSESQISDEEINSQIVVQANDASQASTEMDAAMADAAILMDYDYEFTSNNSVLDYGPCDADVTETNYESTPRSMTVTFTGESDCFAGKKSRTGKMIFTFPQGGDWTTPGAVATVTYQNFKVVRTADEKSVTINGTQTYTNVSGGRLYDVWDGDTSVRTVTSDNMSIKFDSADVRTWHVARKYTTFDTEEQGVNTEITGTHTEGNKTGIAEWGINRFDKAFTTTINAPVVISRYCDGRATSGQITYTTPAFSAIVTLGLNAEGTAASCPESGGYYFKVVASTMNNKTYSTILPY